MIQYLAVAAALGICLWPMLPSLARAVKTGPSYRSAILDLSQVRARLLATGALGDDQKRAIDILTLALVDGSDK